MTMRILLESWGVPLAPMILGLILGPLVEEKFRAGMIASGGSFEPFFTRPISACLVALLLIAIVSKPIEYLLHRFRAKQ